MSVAIVGSSSAIKIRRGTAVSSGVRSVGRRTRRIRASRNKKRQKAEGRVLSCRLLRCVLHSAFCILSHGFVQPAAILRALGARHENGVAAAINDFGIDDAAPNML